MMYGEVYIGERTMQARLQDRRNAHESRRLVHQARSGEPSRLTPKGHKLVGQMSRLLVAIGGRLVAYGLPPYSAVEGELTGNGS